jgi:hypothetical protein
VSDEYEARETVSVLTPPILGLLVSAEIEIEYIEADRVAGG